MTMVLFYNSVLGPWYRQRKPLTGVSSIPDILGDLYARRVAHPAFIDIVRLSSHYFSFHRWFFEKVVNDGMENPSGREKDTVSLLTSLRTVHVAEGVQPPRMYPCCHYRRVQAQVPQSVKLVQIGVVPPTRRHYPVPFWPSLASPIWGYAPSLRYLTLPDVGVIVFLVAYWICIMHRVRVLGVNFEVAFRLSP
ncbi:hypothetical protein IW261DRAFT_555734 [Armillaria novae-zelandiae]|uniref:Uncharacterized protein n=1 Tax=Armillaria novae-zelandiae TaxID=153914 RepID=A0AA39T9P9_9AGAR|nr:hypothetical protein IW261DRAFT_555734 [Armillaria novae-zelandiae]